MPETNFLGTVIMLFIPMIRNHVEISAGSPRQSVVIVHIREVDYVFLP
jgi:hypothetical protein